MGAAVGGHRDSGTVACGWQRYDELGWTVYDDGQQAYLPHVVRDWYALAWFDWHLKGDDAARARLAAAAPFGERTHVRKELR